MLERSLERIAKADSKQAGLKHLVIMPGMCSGLADQVIQCQSLEHRALELLWVCSPSDKSLMCPACAVHVHVQHTCVHSTLDLPLSDVSHALCESKET